MSSVPFHVDTRFVGKNIIITGAGGNFGREGCVYFVTRGATVVGLEKDIDAMGNANDYVQGTLQRVGKIEAKNLINFIHIDVTDTFSVQTAIAKAVHYFRTDSTTKRPVIDLLWNNAGYQGQIAPTLQYDIQDFATVMNVNVTGMFSVMQCVAQKMAAANLDGENSEGSVHNFSIVNTASVAGLRGTPAMVAYSSSKAAVLAMTVVASKVR